MPTELEGQPSGSKMCLMLDPPSLREWNLGFAYLLYILPFYVHMLLIHTFKCMQSHAFT